MNAEKAPQKTEAFELRDRVFEECDLSPEDQEEIKKALYQMVEEPRFLLMGMPDRAKHYLEMNVAQAPQGPKLREDITFIPLWIRKRINDRLKLICNPKREDPYTGLHLIKQNLEHDLPGVATTLIDHPTKDKVLRLTDENYFPVIGLSIGCENQIPDAEKLVEEIQNRYQKWADMIKFLISNNDLPPTGLANAALSSLKTFLKKIPGGDVVGRPVKEWAVKELEKRFGKELAEKICKTPDILDYLVPVVACGNYGATTAKKLYGNNTPLNRGGIKKTKILWDDNKERKEKKERGEEPFTGEGVHDIRVFLKDMGFPMQAEPNDLLVSEPVSEPIVRPENRVIRYLYEKMGLFSMGTPSNSLATAIGCTNNCSFCNTAKHFERQKILLFRDADGKFDFNKMFRSMMKKVEQERKDEMYPPDSYFWILDENFTKTPDKTITEALYNLEKICELVEQSGENIRWGTSTDIAGLVEYKKKYGNFRGLVRGGLNAVWLGIESKADVFNKRGGASEKEVEEIVKELNSLGIGILGSFIVGLPIHTEGETVKNPDGSYEKLNIWEDIEWWLSLNTSANQVMMYSNLNLVKGKKALEEKKIAGRKSSLDLLDSTDEQFGHICFDNQTDIPDERLEKIDRKARRMFFQENGPVGLRSVMTWWDGFMTLRGSKNPAEKKAAIHNYWMAKRNLLVISIGTVLFSETVFEKCSDRLLQRYAKFLSEIDKYSPPDDPLNDKYKEVFELYDKKVFPIAKILVTKMRKRFIKSINHSEEPAKNVEAAEELVDAQDNQNLIDHLGQETNRILRGIQPNPEVVSVFDLGQILTSFSPIHRFIR